MTALQGRIAIVTGAGRGLGRAHALLLAELGARVVVNDNDAAPATFVADEIRSAGGAAAIHVGSVSNWDASAALVRLALDTFGGLDIVVNNAGILRDAYLVSMTEQDWDVVVDVHLKGHFCLLRHAAEHWRAESKAGRPVRASVINTSSGSGLRGNPGQLNYAAAKSGIATMTLVAARELQRYGVRVNAIAPVARTRLTENVPGLGERMQVTDDPFDTWAPENVSPLVAWLASDACQVSGEVFNVVGGHIGRQQTWIEQEAFDADHRWTVAELEEALGKIPAGPTAFVGSA
jgi:NAD(P)-dependent dehydrogenase (short-subunit alcohol dehydrogenase family)